MNRIKIFESKPIRTVCINGEIDNKHQLKMIVVTGVTSTTIT